MNQENKDYAEIGRLATTPKARRFLRGLRKWFDPIELSAVVLIMREAKEAGLFDAPPRRKK